MTHSSNGNGRYQYEYCELRFYPAKTRQRDYSDFMMVVDGDHVDYRSDFLINYMPKLAQLFSIRDLFDPMDNSKSQSITFDQQWTDSYQPISKFVPPLSSTHSPPQHGLDKNGVPIPKGKLKSLWEYNITFKNHISSMFSKLSIAFSPSMNYCGNETPYA